MKTVLFSLFLCFAAVGARAEAVSAEEAEANVPGVCTIAMLATSFCSWNVMVNDHSMQDFSFSSDKNGLCSETGKDSQAAQALADQSAKKLAAAGVCVYLGQRDQ